MKALSLWQPWASAIALGVKKIETRSRYTHYRGELAICATQKKSAELNDVFNELLEQHMAMRFAFADALELGYDTLPFGCVVAVVNLYACGDADYFVATEGELELALGNYAAGRYGWCLKDLKRLAKPVPVVGHQGFFNLPPDVEAKVRGQL